MTPDKGNEEKDPDWVWTPLLKEKGAGHKRRKTDLFEQRPAPAVKGKVSSVWLAQQQLKNGFCVRLICVSFRYKLFAYGTTVMLSR